MSEKHRREVGQLNQEREEMAEQNREIAEALRLTEF